MRKRWGTLFVNVLNASVASSCCGYQKVNTFENIPHADFRRYITVVLIKSRDESIRENDKGSSQLPREFRLDHVGNLVPKTTRCGCCM